MDTHKRTIYKTLTWRVIATIVVVGGVFYYSKDWDLAIKSGIAAAIIKTILYYIHERLWAKTDYGIDYEKLREIKKKKLKKIKHLKLSG